MLDAQQIPSVERLNSIERRLNVLRLLVLAGVVGVTSIVLASGLTPWLSTAVLVMVALMLVTVVIFYWPVVSVYFLLGAAIVIEQWPVREIEPFTSRIPMFQTVEGATGFYLPIAPVEVLLIIAVVATVIPALARREDGFHTSGLFWPVMFFMGAIAIAFFWGMIAQSFDRPFTPPWNKNAAWVEIRGFVYLGMCYLLASNLINTRKRLTTFIWVFIAAVGFKGLQGIYSHSIRRRYDLDVQAITGHEDVVFFSLFLLLLGALWIYGGHHRQRITMLALAPFVTFTIFATTRRMAFFVLAMGVILLGVALWKTRRDLFMKIAPAALVLSMLYTIAFWNQPETLPGQPVRAFRSQFGYTSERDELSDVWRDLENYNVAENIKSSPVTGLGFGRTYEFYVEQPSLEETGFIYWVYITHNAIFWVWMKMGLLGFLAFWWLVGAAIVQGLILFRQLADGYVRAIALAIAGLVMMQVLFSYGDLGLTYSRPMILLGLMLGVLVRLSWIARDAPQTNVLAADTNPPRPVSEATAPARE
jgi:hypothetical protein